MAQAKSDARARAGALCFLLFSKMVSYNIHHPTSCFSSTSSKRQVLIVTHSVNDINPWHEGTSVHLIDLSFIPFALFCFTTINSAALNIQPSNSEHFQFSLVRSEYLFFSGSEGFCGFHSVHIIRTAPAFRPVGIHTRCSLHFPTVGLFSFSAR